MRYALTVLVCLGLASCQTAGAPTGGVVVGTTLPRVLPKVTKADAAVEKGSAKLAQYCSYVRLALGGLDLFINGDQQYLIDDAIAGVNSYCSGPPPTDIRSALYALGDIYQNVMTVHTRKSSSAG